MVWINAVIQGILVGGLYALFATGLSVAFGVMRFVNLAHGDLAILAAFITLSITATSTSTRSWPCSVVLPGAFVFGWVLQKVVFDRVVGVDPAFQIVATFGLSIVIQNLLLEKYTADTQGLDVGDLEKTSIKINDQIAVGWLPLITLLVRGRRARRAGAVPQPHPHGAGLPGDLGRPHRRPADGHRHPPDLRPGHGDRHRHRGAGRRAARRARLVRSVRPGRRA